MKKSIIALFFALFIQGCVNPLSLDVEEPTPIDPNERTIQDDITDNSLSSDIKKIAKKSIYKDALRVNAIVFDRKALLIGQTENSDLNKQFESEVKKIKGLTALYNQIRIRPILTFTQRNNDTWITTKVKSAILGKQGLNGISVYTEAQEVFLVGLVKKEEGLKAAEQVRNMEDVKSVIKFFQYEK